METLRLRWAAPGRLGRSGLRSRLPLERAGEVPWHRVINAKGSISGRGDLVRPDLQRALLEGEGVIFDASGRCDLAIYRWPLAHRTVS